MPSSGFFPKAVGLSRCWRQRRAASVPLDPPQVAWIRCCISTANTAWPWISKARFSYSFFPSLSHFYGPRAAAAELRSGCRELSWRHTGCPNLQHAAPMHSVLLPALLGPLRTWKNALPAAAGNCIALGRLSPRNRGTQFGIALLPHSLPYAAEE